MSRRAKHALPDVVMALSSAPIHPDAPDVVPWALARLLSAIADDCTESCGKPAQLRRFIHVHAVAELLGNVAGQLVKGLALDELQVADQALCHEGAVRPLEPMLTALVAVKRGQLEQRGDW